MDWMWWMWLIVAGVAAIGEVVSTGLFLALIAIAAVVTAIIAVLMPFVGAQIVIFAALSLVGIVLIRPVLVNALGWEAFSQVAVSVPQSHIVNKRAVVTQQVDAHGGQIRVGQGEFWSARSFDPSDDIPPDTVVEVVLVEGVTALVAPVSQPALESYATMEKGN